ncbi:MAG: YitT family protein [Symbiobacteriia bacterium]
MFWRQASTEARHAFGIILGSTLVALSLSIFIVPNRIVDGGVTGLAVLGHYLAGLPVGWLILAINVPIFLVGIRFVGLPFGLRSLLGVVAISITVELTAHLPAVTNDLLLASVFGGILSGIGMGLVLRSQGSLGGTDILAVVLSHLFGFTVGELLLGIDILIIGSAAIVFDVERAMYALITMFVASKVVDVIQEGWNHTKTMIIISDQTEAIAARIMQELERGVTFLHGEGAYSGKSKRIIWAVVTRVEIARVKQMVWDLDHDAFVTVADAHEVLGEGFKRPIRGGLARR